MLQFCVGNFDFKIIFYLNDKKKFWIMVINICL